MEPWDHGTMENGTVALTSYFSGNVRELDDKCNSMMQKTLKKDNTGHLVYKCVVWFPNPLAAGSGLGERRGQNALFFL